MKLNTLLVTTAVIAVIFGLVFLFAPEKSVALYGVALGPGGAVMTRFFGATLLGFAVLTWLARNETGSATRKAVIPALIVTNVAGFVVALAGQLSGLVNALGWSTVAIYVFLAMGFVYFQFVKPGASKK